MQRFFVEPHQIDGERHEIHITGSDVNHIVNVLRMKKGEELWISDKEKEYHCVIENAGEDEVLLHILYVQEPDYELKNRIYLFQGLPKADKMELIIQKAVELGAYSVVPVSTRRCVVKLDNKKAEKKVSRWQQIAESAAKQSKRMLVPEVHSVMTFKEALAYAKELDVLLIPYELAKGMKETKELIQAIEKASVFLSARRVDLKSRKWQMPWKPVQNPLHWDTGSYGQKLQDLRYFLF